MVNELIIEEWENGNRRKNNLIISESFSGSYYDASFIDSVINKVYDAFKEYGLDTSENENWVVGRVGEKCLACVHPDTPKNIAKARKLFKKAGLL